MITRLPLIVLLSFGSFGIVGALGCAAQTDDAPASAATDDVASVAERWDTESATDEASSTHQWLVNTALEMIRDAHVADDPARAGVAAELLAQGNDCSTAWRQGINDADMLPQYNDGIDYTHESRVQSGVEALFKGGWRSHFYDPDTGTNYWNQKSPNAKERSLAHYADSLRSLGPSGALTKGACYELGLALHYMTDLTQPMHAANFTNSGYPIYFHGNYESWAMKSVQPRMTAPSWGAIDAPDDAAPDAILEAAAHAAKAQWPALHAEHDAAARPCRFSPVDLLPCWSHDHGMVTLTEAALAEAAEYTAHYVLRWIDDATSTGDRAAAASPVAAK